MGGVLVFWSQKAMQILPFPKSDTVLTPCKWENLQTNSSWPLTEPKRPANNANLTAADNLS